MTVKMVNTDWESSLAKLVAPELRVSLSRSMGVAGGKVLRDEAKRLAPVKTGRLRDAIYLAFKTERSTNDVSVYGITWNNKKDHPKRAPHGHLVEFGHAMVVGGKPVGKGGVQIGFVPARPFLRPAFDAVNAVAKRAMIERGRVRASELLKGIK